MRRREFLGGVAAGVATALLPLPALGQIEAAPMTATEVGARHTVFQKQYMAEFFAQFEQQRFLSDLTCYGRSVVKVMNMPARPWIKLENVPHD